MTAPVSLEDARRKADEAAVKAARAFAVVAGMAAAEAADPPPAPGWEAHAIAGVATAAASSAAAIAAAADRILPDPGARSIAWAAAEDAADAAEDARRAGNAAR